MCRCGREKRASGQSVGLSSSKCEVNYSGMIMLLHNICSTVHIFLPNIVVEKVVYNLGKCYRLHEREVDTYAFIFVIYLKNHIAKIRLGEKAIYFQIHL